MNAPRFASVDALRGLTVALMLLVNTPGDWGHVVAPLLHARWHGCTVADLVFPMFLFVVGVSVALGIVPRREQGDAVAVLRRAALLRALRIVALGLLLHLLAWWLLDPPAFRPFGVLQRVGLCFAACALAALYLRARGQWLLCGVLVAGWWWLLAATGGVAPGTNFADRVDAALLGIHAYRFDAATGLGHEPEGLLTTLPAIATTLLGLRAGDWLRHGRLRALVVAGAALACAGLLASPVLPFNKGLWTSSYVLWTGGLSMLALAAVHVLVDRRGWPAVGRAPGINAVVVYAGAAVATVLLDATGAGGAVYRAVFLPWLSPGGDERLASLGYAVAFVALWWGIAGWMARRGWRVTI